MNEKPIMFMSSLLKGIMDGKKTQERMRIKEWFGADPVVPYEVGDILYVQEMWRPFMYDFQNHKVSISYQADLNYTDFRKYPEEDEGMLLEFREREDRHKAGLWKAPSTLPAWAARTFLRVTKVELQGLHTMTDEEAIAEGIVQKTHDGKEVYGLPEWSANTCKKSPREAFISLWKLIYPYADSEEQVWKIEFELLKNYIKDHYHV